MREKILAALKKLGPSAPGAIAKEISEKPEHVGYHMRAMAVAKALKAGGAGRARHYALPDQDLAGHRAPPPAAFGAAQAGRQAARRCTGRCHAARRALHPGRRRGEAPLHHQRRRAAQLQRGADAEDRRAALRSLRGLT